ncbi:hypothetical protein HPB47_000745 [Ixodes persulcatus]|uniref:Uncharacterized protein n=1 Tax=Ixodes persulcatus TaxID=34615 RepID=A0AC60PR20_IXOPE|nr:hypothetical protein HPB47_000745 [Ixodes persulcatus]
MEFDAQSGRTLTPPGPWQQILRERRNLKNPPANPPRPSEPRQSTNRPPGTPAPRLPDSDYKVVFRPRTGLRVAAWNDRQLTQSLQQASKIPEHIFYARVTVQIQASQNLIVAGTPEENCALALSEISTIQLGAATHEVLPYLKPLPGTRRGVIHGLDPGTTTDQLPHILAYNGARILHARMLGNSTSAVVTFEGIHVPFYIKAYGHFTRCRPYRQTVQCCCLCGELGRRQDVCANPDTTMCAQCHTRDPTPDHDCTPKCQLCGLAHPTASKDCRKELRPPPPPLRVRERALTSQRWQQQPSSNSQPPEQRRFPPNQPNQQQVSWSANASPPPTAHDQFPLLPTRPTQTPDPRIQTLQQENTLLKQQLEATSKRTTTLEQRIEQLLMQVELLLQHPVQRPQDPTPERDPDATPPLTQIELSAQHQIQPLKARPLIGTPRLHHLPLAPLRPFRQILATLSASSTRWVSASTTA